MIGRVVSTKTKNTATILVERTAKDPLYKKTYKQSKKYLVDDQIGVKLGDIVDITACKPISKRKSFRINKVLGKNFAEIAEEHLKEKAEQAIAEVMPEEKEEVKTEEPADTKEKTAVENSKKKVSPKKKKETK